MKYGMCGRCGEELLPVFFTEEEVVYAGYGGCRYPVKTGRTRKAVDYLVCENCGKKVAVDDTFDGSWHH